MPDVKIYSTVVLRGMPQLPSQCIEAGQSPGLHAQLASLSLGARAVWDGDDAAHPTGTLITLSPPNTPQEAHDILDGLRKSGPEDQNHRIAHCFAAGAKIRTPGGDVAVQDLRVGDAVTTLDNGPRPLRWIGVTRVPATGTLAPVRFAAGALSDGLPTEDLLVSPKHRMVVRGWRAEVLFGEEEVLVAAKDLVNDTTITRCRDFAHVEYHHLLFDAHEIVFSNGAASESFNPGELSLSFIESSIREEIISLFPNLRTSLGAYGKAVRTVVTGKEARLIAE